MKRVEFRESVLDTLPMYVIENGVAILKLEETDLKESLLEDFPELKNEKEEIILNRIKRYRKVVEDLKIKYNNRCQICGFTFEKINGKGYSEAHHVVKLADNGSQDENNVVIVCANHHRMFHYAKEVKYHEENNILVGVTMNGIYYPLHGTL